MKLTTKTFKELNRASTASDVAAFEEDFTKALLEIVGRIKASGHIPSIRANSREDYAAVIWQKPRISSLYGSGRQIAQIVENIVFDSFSTFFTFFRVGSKEDCAEMAKQSQAVFMAAKTSKITLSGLFHCLHCLMAKTRPFLDFDTNYMTPARLMQAIDIYCIAIERAVSQIETEKERAEKEANRKVQITFEQAPSEVKNHIQTLIETFDLKARDEKAQAQASAQKQRSTPQSRFMQLLVQKFSKDPVMTVEKRNQAFLQKVQKEWRLYVETEEYRLQSVELSQKHKAKALEKAQKEADMWGVALSDQAKELALHNANEAAINELEQSFLDKQYNAAIQQMLSQ